VEVGIHVSGHTLGSGVAQQGAGVHQHQRVVVDVDDPRLGRDPLGDLVGVLHRGQASADVEKLTYPGLTG
jgi:hypothetical protein